MVDLSGIQGASNLAGAFAGAEKVKKEQDKQKKIRPDRGLGLEHIPETPAPGYIEESEEIEENADTILDKIDQELEDLQQNIKNVLAKKIKLADKHRDDEDKQHRLLVSAYDDCKNAYSKIKEVREDLA